MNRFIGSIARQGKFVDGSLQQHAWNDKYLTAHPIRYDGELTPEVCERAVEAYNKHQAKTFKRDCYPSLRTMERPEAIEVDIESRQLLVENTTTLWD